MMRTGNDRLAHGTPLAGKVALVTGGAGGLGSATCGMLAQCGASVVAADIRGDAASTFAHVHTGIAATAADLTSEESMQSAFGFVIERFGRLDILINNAGIDVTCPVEDLEVEDWDRVLDVNLRAPFVLSRLAFAHMRESGGGQIVNIVSTAAKRAWANAAAYHASKWGLLGLSHALHAEGRSKGIKVCAIVSGGMRTPFLLDRFPDIDESTLQDPAAVAEAIVFVLTRAEAVVVPEMMVLPMKETSWP
jgi:NAD(P)-dependent dehydrogenase (short-subunit alcohol dehydrogenase family)